MTKGNGMIKIAALYFGLVMLTIPFPGGAQMLIANIDHRDARSLDGPWAAIVDPYETGYYSYRYEPRDDGYFLDQKPESKSDLIEYDFDAADRLHVPGDWNSQRPELFLYEGTVWYRRLFDAEPTEDPRLFLYFGAANYRATVYLNGERLGEHEGGFTPFCFEITGRARPENNSLVVKVDNVRRRDAVPTVITDWWNYGGLTRRVKLVSVPETFIRDAFIQLKAGSLAAIEGWVELDGPRANQNIAIEIPEAGIEHEVAADQNGRAAFEFPANLELWSPENPKLYRVRVVAETDVLEDEIGFRSLAVRGSEILLNGEPIFLRGISIHEEAPLREGRAFAREDARTLLGWARDLGCNFVRLAHYPHNEFMLREADRMGMLVWSEIPVYWTILWENEATLDNARRQLGEMIVRDRNRASVAVWSVANETPRGEARLAFLRDLIDRARELDPTRPVAAATELSWGEKTMIIDDPLAEHLDVIGVNEYFGWYGGQPEEAPQWKWETAFDKPLIVSEFGAGALQGFHGDERTRWTEEYQAAVYRHQIAMLRGIPFLAGMSPWILKDFRSPRRPLARIQDFWNRKGLISERGERKRAFGVLRDFYEEKRGEKAE